MLFECTMLKEEREMRWAEVVNNVPRPTIESMEKMSFESKVVFIVSGFNSRYVVEFAHIYTSFLKFITAMYKKQQTLIT